MKDHCCRCNRSVRLNDWNVGLPKGFVVGLPLGVAFYEVILCEDCNNILRDRCDEAVLKVKEEFYKELKYK